jgi:K+-transporting ATPase ATPase C chain
MQAAFRFSMLVFILCGLAYPLAVTGLGQCFFPEPANGSLIYGRDGHILGSRLLGQSFSQPRYFQPRPSANGYDASNSGGSNLGATHHTLIERVVTDTALYRQNNTAYSPPPDGISSSASGLDPHISLENALRQLPRVAKQRSIHPAALRQIVHQQAASQCGWIEKLSHACDIVPVLKLNLALDDMSQQGGH